MDELKIGEERVVWRYSFRPIYKRFVLEKCVYGITKYKPHIYYLHSIRPLIGYTPPAFACQVGLPRENHVLLEERNDLKAIDILKNYYKRKIEKCPIEKIGNYVDRLPHLTLENLTVYDGT